MTYSSLGTEIDLPGSPAYKKYWDARAKQCRMFADEGSCLARVARHVPVSIEMGGLGFTSEIPALETNQLKQHMLAWGAWPNTDANGNPLYLFASNANGTMPTISTSRALTLLKYEVVAAGIAGLALGWMMHRRGAVQANRRRRRR